MRRALLALAASVPVEVHGQLTARLAQDGPVHLSRALADWTRPEVADWLPVLRRHGVAVRHHFRTRDSHDPDLVALTVEALTLAASAEVDHVVLAGDVGAATPLVARLRELGIHVTGVGPARTPHDFREACDVFWEYAELGRGSASGRHRAT